MKTFKDRLTTGIAALAILTNSAGMALPFILTQKAAAAVGDPEITNVDAYYSSGTDYTGIMTDFSYLKQVADVIKTEIIVHGDDTPHSIEATQQVLDGINASPDTSVTRSGTVLITGSRTSSSWTPQAGTWTGSERPTHVEVRITLTDNTVFSKVDDDISNHNGNTQETVFANVPEITHIVAAKHDATNYKGISVDTGTANITDAKGISVTIERADGSTVVKNSKPAPSGSITGVNAGGVTTPFVIQQGTYDEAGSGSWFPAPATWTSATRPIMATVLITLGNDSTVEMSVPITISQSEYLGLLVTPSTNDINKTKGWAHVNELNKNVGSVELEFVSERNFPSCFEYRTDGDTSQVIAEENGGVNYNSEINDGLYPYFCQNNNSRVETISANEYVEVRMVFGGEKDERFTWTRFDVLSDTTAPEVSGVVLNGETVNVARSENCGPTDFNAVSGNINLSATITDDLSGVSSAKYKIRKVTSGGCTQTGVYQSSTVNMSNPGGDNWITLPGSELETIALQEGSYTIMMTVTDNAGNTATKYVDITVDNTKPAGSATYEGGVEVAGVRYVQSIDDLKFTETITDNHSVVRATFLVQRLNTSTGDFEGFCGNWNAHSSGNHVLGGTTHEVYTENNVKSCKNDVSQWTDGTYKIFHAAYDEAGNEGKYNTDRQVFVIDSTAPDLYMQLSIDGLVLSGDVHARSRINDADASKPAFHRVTYIDGVVFKDETNTQRNSEIKFNTSSYSDGLHTLRVVATDAAGNSSEVIETFTVDNTAPDVPTGLNYTTTSGTVLASGDTTNEPKGTFDWDNVSDAVRYNLYVWTDNPDSPVHAIDISGKFITDPDGFTDSEVPGDLEGLQAGEYPQHVCVTAVDAAGNESACSTPFSLTFISGSVAGAVDCDGDGVSDPNGCEDENGSDNSADRDIIDELTNGGTVLGTSTDGQALAETDGLANTGTQNGGIVALVAASLMAIALVVLRRKQEN